MLKSSSEVVLDEKSPSKEVLNQDLMGELMIYNKEIQKAASQAQKSNATKKK